MRSITSLTRGATYTRGDTTSAPVLPSATAVKIAYNLKFSRIKYFVVWLNSAQKQIFVVERESGKVHTSTKFFTG